MASILGIVPTYRHLDYAHGAVTSFLQFTPDAEVLLVDDGSPEWGTIDWGSWPCEHFRKHHFAENRRDLTRSWNHGLQQARKKGFTYVVMANSDLLFTPGWWKGQEKCLGQGLVLTGPMTNAPGHRKKQQVGRAIPDYQLGDDPAYLAQVAKKLRRKYDSGHFWRSLINGFCMAARVDTLWKYAFDRDHVFNPARKYRLTGNEDELQGRIRKSNGGIAVVPASFVFHYRGVSRGAGGLGKFRKPK